MSSRQTMSRRPSRAYPVHPSQKQASVLLGALMAAMKKFSSSSDVTGVECKVTPAGKITHVLVCAYTTDEHQDLVAWYRGLEVFLRENARLLPVTDIMFYIGYNYHKPGLISVKNGNVQYSRDRDFLDHPRMASCSMAEAVGLDRYFVLSKEGSAMFDAGLRRREDEKNTVDEAWEEFWQSMADHGILSPSEDEMEPPGFEKLEQAIEGFKETNPTAEQVAAFAKAMLAFGESFS